MFLHTINHKWYQYSSNNDLINILYKWPQSTLYTEKCANWWQYKHTELSYHWIINNLARKVYGRWVKYTAKTIWIKNQDVKLYKSMTCGFQDIMIYRYFKCKFINSEMKLLHQNFKNPERCIPYNDFPSKIQLVSCACIFLFGDINWQKFWQLIF